MAYIPDLFSRASNTNGTPESGAKRLVYEAGTTTPVTTYSDRAFATAQAFPVVANSGGVFATSYVPSGNYKIRITDADDNLLFERDHIRVADRPDDPVFFDTYALLLASEDTYETGTFVIAMREVLTFESAASGATDSDIVNAGGQKFYWRKAEFDTVADFLNSVEPSRGVGSIWEAGGYRYEEVASGGHVTNAGGVEFKVLPGALIFPSTGPSGDDAPNIILGSYGAVDLPASTYGNLVGGPRNPDVSGGVGYRNRLGSTTNLSIILGGDNDIDALSAFNIGHHNAADVTDGASHPMMIGSYLNAGEAYAIAMGTENDNWARNAAIVGGRDHRIGTQGAGTDARNSFIGGGATNTIDGQYAGIIGGQLCKAKKDYSYAGGYGAVANTAGERVFSSVLSGTSGFRQVSEYHVSRDISGALATQLLSAGAVRTVIGAKSTVSLQAQINAARTDVEGETGAWVLNAQISNMGGTWAVKSQSVTTVHADVSTGGGRTAWEVDVIATGGTWQVRFKGEDAMTFIVDAYVREIMTRKE